ncbi:hypothetical protein KOR42_23950 [Thalassoglobus neptunius]|uniref:Uncharacterized protein n=1 Tax=Thalassoglobus neptunius TaxID=1938619 RepID=A0A5C5X850_9PLAN|nr:hypothetical protein KOR42_23950 [Thalassoglobus neptunius]
MHSKLISHCCANAKPTANCTTSPECAIQSSQAGRSIKWLNLLDSSQFSSRGGFCSVESQERGGTGEFEYQPGEVPGLVWGAYGSGNLNQQSPWPCGVINPWLRTILETSFGSNG